LSDPALELRRPRKLEHILGEGLKAYGRDIRVLLLGAAAVIVPANALVNADAFGQGFQEKADLARQAIDIALAYLVISPLIAAMAIGVLRARAEGRAPRFVDTLRSALDVFAPLFLVVLAALAGIMLGLLALIVPGIYLAVRWLFVSQTVVVEDKRGLAALSRSSELVQGGWWRVAGIALAVNVCALVPSGILTVPFTLGAKAADAEALTLIGTMLGQTVAAPFVALCTALLFYDLVAREAGAALPGPQARLPAEGWQPPPPLDRIPREPDAPEPSERPPDPPGLPPREEG